MRLKVPRVGSRGEQQRGSAKALLEEGERHSGGRGGVGQSRHACHRAGRLSGRFDHIQPPLLAMPALPGRAEAPGREARRHARCCGGDGWDSQQTQYLDRAAATRARLAPPVDGIGLSRDHHGPASLVCHVCELGEGTDTLRTLDTTANPRSVG